MKRTKLRLRTPLLLLLLLTVATLLAACPTERLRPSFAKAGIMRDTIYSVEERGLGAVMVWVTHSDREGYCFTNQELAARARSLIREHTGEVLIEFREAGVLDSLNPCANTEAETQYTVYLGESITTAPAR
jgi:predicted small secreted protein